MPDAKAEIEYLKGLRARLLSQQPPGPDRDRTIAQIDRQLAEATGRGEPPKGCEGCGE